MYVCLIEELWRFEIDENLWEFFYLYFGFFGIDWNVKEYDLDDSLFIEDDNLI